MENRRVAEKYIQENEENKMKHAEKYINGDSYNRSAGILLPVFSLPSPYGIGDMGEGAYRFVDMLREAGQTLWEVLPHGQTGYCNSPYKTLSAFAGNPYFIAPDMLEKDGLLLPGEAEQYDFGANSADIDYGRLFAARFKLLRLAFDRFCARGGKSDSGFLAFRRKNAVWLSDYALFMALKEHFGWKPWNEWEEGAAFRRPEVLRGYRRRLAVSVLFWQFVQYEFFCQWHQLKKYAGRNGIKIIGDLPFYVAYDSADVWSRRNIFAVNPEDASVTLSAGVPGDCFASHTRSWDMPCYDWPAAAADKFRWHLERFRFYAGLYDAIRIDHAIGFVRYYGLGRVGERWYDGPDAENDVFIPKLTRLAKSCGVELIAEDLGSVPERAYRLFTKYRWAGTRVLQFGFANGYGTETIHLPFYYPHKSVAYTGTHDNPAFASYLQGLEAKYLPYLRYYLQASPQDNLQKRCIEELYRSAAEKVIIPLPDILGLDNRGRIAHGRDYAKSWRWRLSSLDDISEEIRQWLKKLAFAYARIPFSHEQGKEYGWNWK